jgi:sphingosine kinase
MTMALGVDEDPFKDPSLDAASTPRALPRQQPPTDVPATLAVGRNASLTLGTDSLVVLGIDYVNHSCTTQELTRNPDEALLESNGASCCGVRLSGS